MNIIDPEQAREVVRQFLARLKGVDGNPLPIIKGHAEMILKNSSEEEARRIANVHLALIAQLEELPTATRALTPDHAKLIQTAYDLMGDDLMSHRAWEFFESFAERERLFPIPDLDGKAKQSINSVTNSVFIHASLIDAKKTSPQGRVAPGDARDQQRN